jgi:ubiquinone/menaquinone biosynthesis C-methylase UbiE
LGGGFGRNTRHYRNASARYLIVDCSAANLTNVGELLTDDLAAGRCFLVPADLNALPFVDATFGATMVVQVHHHLPDIERALAEMGRPVGDRWLIDISVTRHVSACRAAGTAGRGTGQASWRHWRPAPAL